MFCQANSAPFSVLIMAIATSSRHLQPIVPITSFIASFVTGRRQRTHTKMQFTIIEHSIFARARARAPSFVCHLKCASAKHRRAALISVRARSSRTAAIASYFCTPPQRARALKSKCTRTRAHKILHQEDGDWQRMQTELCVELKWRARA